MLRESMDRLREVLSLGADTVEANVLTTALSCIRNLEMEYKVAKDSMELMRTVQR